MLARGHDGAGLKRIIRIESCFSPLKVDVFVNAGLGALQLELQGAQSKNINYYKWL